jgi:hypothetical protein
MKPVALPQVSDATGLFVGQGGPKLLRARPSGSRPPNCNRRNKLCLAVCFLFLALIQERSGFPRRFCGGTTYQPFLRCSFGQENGSTPENFENVHIIDFAIEDIPRKFGNSAGSNSAAVSRAAAAA